MMENWLIASWPQIWKTAVSCIGIFTVIIFITRFSGLRTFAKMSSFDFASTIAIGSILATIILNSNHSLLKGSVALVCIVSLQSAYTFLTRKSANFSRFAKNEPLMLMENGEIIHQALTEANVSEDDLIAKLREANVIEFNEVKAVVFETTGDISVLHTSDKTLEQRLLQGVRRV